VPALNVACCCCWGQLPAAACGFCGDEAKTRLAATGDVADDHSVHWLLIWKRDLAPDNSSPGLQQNTVGCLVFLFDIFDTEKNL
jgi:hypothetical protein